MLVCFLFLLRVRGESKNSVGSELFCQMLVVTLLAQATETISFLLDGVPLSLIHIYRRRELPHHRLYRRRLQTGPAGRAHPHRAGAQSGPVSYTHLDVYKRQG